MQMLAMMSLFVMPLLWASHVTAAAESQAGTKAVEWVKRHVSCDGQLNCKTDVDQGRKKSDTDVDDDASNDKDGSDIMAKACPNLQLDPKQSFNLKLVNETFKGIDEKGTEDDILNRTETRTFIKALELLESCLESQSAETDTDSDLETSE